MTMLPYSDRVALVTGAGRGVGREIALGLARGGAKVVANDMDAAPLQDLAQALGDGDGALRLFPGDVTKPDFGERFVDAAVEAFHGVDIIVNNAGFTWDGMIQNMSDEQFEAMIAVHLTAPFRILRAALGPMKHAWTEETARGEEVMRKVVNIASVSGTRGNVGQTNYAAAKSGLIGLTKALAKEWGRYKINVNAIAFGFVETRLTAPAERGARAEVGGVSAPMGIPDAARERMLGSIALGRPATPKEAAGAVLMMCGPWSDYISGQVIEAAGGLAM